MITLIVNPAAGSGRAKKVGFSAEKTLEARHLPHRVWETARPGHATELAKQAAADYHEGDLLIAVGGDGTLLETVRGVLGSELPLAQIPAGTGNDFIKSVGLPQEPQAALEQILRAAPRRVDVGTLNDEVFINECGTGFDVVVLDYAARAKRYVRGLLPYLWGVIRTIFSYRPQPLTVTADGETVFSGNCLVVSVANGRYIGGGIPISPKAELGSGKLELTVMAACKRGQMLGYLAGLLKGKILTFPHTVVHCRASGVTISGQNAPDLRVNVDGEITDMACCAFTVKPRALLIQM